MSERERLEKRWGFRADATRAVSERERFERQWGLDIAPPGPPYDHEERGAFLRAAYPCVLRLPFDGNSPDGFAALSVERSIAPYAFLTPEPIEGTRVVGIEGGPPNLTALDYDRAGALLGLPGGGGYQ